MATFFKVVKKTFGKSGVNNSPSTDQMCREILLEHRPDILRSADVNNVFLDRLTDHLLSKRCLQVDQIELIKTERLSRDRCTKLLDFVASEGHRAFQALCDALEQFGTDSKSQLATTMRKVLNDKRWQEGSLRLIQSLDENKKRVWGLTTLNNTLYVAYWDEEKNNFEFVVYETSTYSRQHSLHVPQVGGVIDMTSCTRFQCVYIADDKNKVVHRVENKNKIAEWPVNDEPHGLSVNSAHNVLVTCVGLTGKIKEFTSDGQLVREVYLQRDIVNPWHTVELTTDQFVVCHGRNRDTMNRVCIVNGEGNVIHSYGEQPGSGNGQLCVPIRLLVVNSLICVADRNNHRVLMLSPTTLSYVRELVSGLDDPCRLWVDQHTERLYIADSKRKDGTWVCGRLKIYGII